MDLETPLPGKNVCLVSWIRQEDLKAKKLADSITFNGIIQDLTEGGYSCSYLYEGEFGHIGFFMNLFWKFKEKRGSPNSPISQHPVLSNLFSLFLTFYSLASYRFKRDVKRKLGTFDVIVVAGPALMHPIHRAFKNSKYLVLYELNIEAELFAFNNKGMKTFVNNTILNLIKITEMKALQLSNRILTTSPRDSNSLKKLFPMKEVDYYYPFYKREVTSVARRPLKITDRNRQIDLVLEDKHTVIGFIASCSTVNCRALSGIVSIAKRVNSQTVIFAIVGNIYSCSCVGDMPTNMVFTGFLDNPDDLMQNCDAFILFDVQPTGIEVKAQSYRLYNKPVLVISEYQDSNYLPFLGNRMIECKDSDEAIKVIYKLAEKKLIGN
jgi:hypothetical protein